MQPKSIKEQVKAVFSEYIEANGQRKTPERFAVLDAAYSIHGHFNCDMIQHILARKKFKVTMSTIHSALEVLCAAGLIFKYQFGNGPTLYERAYNRDAHYHQICTSCGSVSDFESEALDEALRAIQLPYFQASSYQVHGYGLCAHCATRLRTATTDTAL